MYEKKAGEKEDDILRSYGSQPWRFLAATYLIAMNSLDLMVLGCVMTFILFTVEFTGWLFQNFGQQSREGAVWGLSIAFTLTILASPLVRRFVKEIKRGVEEVRRKYVLAGRMLRGEQLS